MESQFTAVMESADHPAHTEIAEPQLVIQQYARYPPALESMLQSASSLGSARSHVDANTSPGQRKGTPRSLQSSPSGVRSGIPPSSFARSGLSMSPPAFRGRYQSQAKDAADQAESRMLPSREVSDETIDDAYVMFILYCNPNVPSSVDTFELRRTFRCPPRSDGKSFSVFTLFELIRKLDNKELKTWIQLAIELGVEPPSMEKKQSAQKVQQYAVRLKRWMRAMHVDAFFEYCLGHPHAYYTELPPSGSSVCDSRDGVPLEEDLALRALVPQWKPKRGRKRAEERGLDDEKPLKRPLLDTSAGILRHGDFQAHSVTFPQSAIPFSAFPEELESNDPWMTASSFPTGNGSVSANGQQGQDLRWRFPERDPSPAGYPRSAIIPRGIQQSDVIISAEPRSAVTPSSGEKSRAKRRHGPAVSSAWPGGSGSSAGKTRGRPPNKASAFGSFSTFQVNPPQESSQNPNASLQSSPLVSNQNPPQPIPNQSCNHSPTPVATGRPSKLQLQVPQHSGAPIRLATPPALVVNGVNSAIISQAGGSGEPHQRDIINSGTNRTAGSASSTTPNGNGSGHAKLSIDEIVRTLSMELFRATTFGRPTRLSFDEARSLASAMVMNLSKLCSQIPIEGHLHLLVLHLGLGHQFGLMGIPPGARVVKIDLPDSDAGSGVSGVDESSSGLLYTVSYEYKHSCRFSMQITLGDIGAGDMVASPSYDAAMATKQKDDTGALDGSTDFDLEGDNINEPASERTWKQRYSRLRAQMHKKEHALSQYKRKIVESVMADI